MKALLKLRNRFSRLPINFVHYLRSLPPIERRLDRKYSELINRHSAQLPALNESDFKIVRDLCEHGYHVTDLARLDLLNSRKMFDAANLIVGDIRKRFSVSPQSFVDKELIMATRDEAVEMPTVYRWGLDTRLLAIIENYIGLPVAYNGYHLFYTVPTYTERGARKWHRDGEDQRMVKVAVYLNDVGRDGGPLEVLLRSPFKGASQASVLTQKQLDRRMSAAAAAENTRTFEGSAGTVIFVDSARLYHRGRPLVDGDRGAIYYNYFSQMPRYRYFCDNSIFLDSDIKSLTFDLDDYQRSAALWRKSAV